MKMIAIMIFLFLATVALAAQNEFTTICDFDNIDRVWTVEPGSTLVKKTRSIKAHSGKVAMEINVTRNAHVLRATWGCDLSDIGMTSESRFKFWIKGSKFCKTSIGQPHGGILLIESGGAKNGADSHWLLDIPNDVYAQTEWTEIITQPIMQATNPDWAPDANGKPDIDRIHKILFVAQQEDPAQILPEYTIYIDDISISNNTTRQMIETVAVNESVPKTVRAVQRGFVGRKRDVGQQVLFNDLTDWKVKHFEGTEVSLVKSLEEPLFGEPVAKLTYRSTGAPGYFRLEPPKPIKLEKFNGVLMWVMGNVWEWMPDPETPFVLLSMIIEDAKGEMHTIQMNPVAWKFWSVMHKCIKLNASDDERHSAFGGDGNWKLDFPAKLIAIEVTGANNRDWRSIYLDSVIFRTEKPTTPSYNPETLKKLDNQPFPTTPDTFMPAIMQPVKNSVVEKDKSYVFSAVSDSQKIEYTYTPKTGTLSDLKVKTEKVSLTPCLGGGPRFVENQTPKADLVSSSLKNGKLTTAWKTAKGIEYTLTLSIKGKTMVCEWSSNSSAFKQVSPGRAEGLSNFKQFNVPYLTLGWGLPSIIWNKGQYMFTMFDIYNSNASCLPGQSQIVSETSATCVAPAGYGNLTDGTRNKMHERQFITISNKFEEVLPSIPNPPSPLSEITGKYLYCHVGALEIDRLKRSLERWKLFKEYGIDHVRVSHHEDSFSDADTALQGPQEFTMTLEAAPELGDAQMKEYCSETRKLGYLVGLYTNYTDYSPLGAVWDDKNVVKQLNGEWQRAWPPTFAIKPLKAVEMEAYFAHRISEKFGTNTVYCDVHTALPPMQMVDFEAGNPWAGMEKAQVKAYGTLFLNERKSYNGPVFSEGSFHWIYAGLNDGNYAQMGSGDAANWPFLLDFDLRKIHPLQANVSMTPGWSWGEGVNHCMAAQIAYGHIGFMPFADPVDACWGYYMMQQLQSRYTQVPVDKILYYDKDGKSYEISEAIPVNANANNQVLVTYTNGLNIYVNCNKNRSWTVEVDGKSYTLPKFGWIAWDKDFIEYSTEIDGARINFVDSPVYTYLETGAKTFNEANLETTGTVILRKDDPRGPKIIPVKGSSATVYGDWSTATAYKGDGIELGPAKIQKTAKGLTIKYQDDARYYILK